MKLRRHFSAAAKDTGDSHLLQRHFLAKRFEQFGSREETANVVVSLQQREALLHNVLLVLLGHLWLAHLEQLDDPARIEIDHETDTATMLRQVLDRETQPTWTSWPERQPVRTFRKELFRQRVAKRFVVETEVFDIDTRLRHTRAAAGLERVDRSIRVTFRHPATHWATAQPLVLEKTETRKILVSLDLLAWIPREILREVEPERATGFRIEMPRNNFPNPRV